MSSWYNSKCSNLPGKLTHKVSDSASFVVDFMVYLAKDSILSTKSDNIIYVSELIWRLV